MTPTHITWGSGKTCPIDEGIEIACDSVGPGWGSIVRSLMADLLDLGWDGTLLQIKEKFGGLRFYTGSLTDSMWIRLTQAEEESQVTCDACGGPGQTTSFHGWLVTKCPGCLAVVEKGEN